MPAMVTPHNLNQALANVNILLSTFMTTTIPWYYAVFKMFCMVWCPILRPMRRRMGYDHEKGLIVGLHRMRVKIFHTVACYDVSEIIFTVVVAITRQFPVHVQRVVVETTVA